MTRKEKIIEIVAKYYLLSIKSMEDVSRMDRWCEDLADAILSLPLDMPSDVNIEDIADKKHPCYNDHVDSNAIDCNIGFIEGAKWAINEILKRNGIQESEEK